MSSQWDTFCRKCGREHRGRTIDGNCLLCVEEELTVLRRRVKEYEQREKDQCAHWVTNPERNRKRSVDG